MSNKQPNKQNSNSNLTNWLKLPNKLSMAAQRKEEVLWNWGQPGLHSKTQSQTKAETRSTLQNLPIPPTVALPFAPKAFCKQSWFTRDHSVPVRAASFPFLLWWFGVSYSLVENAVPLSLAGSVFILQIGPKCSFLRTHLTTLSKITIEDMSSMLWEELFPSSLRILVVSRSAWERNLSDNGDFVLSITNSLVFRAMPWYRVQAIYSWVSLSSQGRWGLQLNSVT